MRAAGAPGGAAPRRPTRIPKLGEGDGEGEGEGEGARVGAGVGEGREDAGGGSYISRRVSRLVRVVTPVCGCLGGCGWALKGEGRS